jgi:adenylosuccinate lyase
MLSMLSIQKGMNKISANPSKIAQDLDNNWSVLAEAVQTILRREGVANPYELLKDLTRGKAQITKEELHAFVSNLDIPDKVKIEIKLLTPSNYTGMHSKLSEG